MPVSFSLHQQSQSTRWLFISKQQQWKQTKAPAFSYIPWHVNATCGCLYGLVGGTHTLIYFHFIFSWIHFRCLQGMIEQISQLNPLYSPSWLRAWTWVELHYRCRGLSVETWVGGAMLRVDAAHSYITKLEIIRSGNSDPWCAFMKSYLSLKNLHGLM